MLQYVDESLDRIDDPRLLYSSRAWHRPDDTHRYGQPSIALHPNRGDLQTSTRSDVLAGSVYAFLLHPGGLHNPVSLHDCGVHLDNIQCQDVRENIRLMLLCS